jgi:hypothetical protein
MMPDLAAQTKLMNKLGDPFTYRLMLGGLALQYGRSLLRQALIEAAGRAGGNVVSIAAAPNWLRSKAPPEELCAKVGDGMKG